MAHASSNSRIVSRSSRDRLAPRHEPYWHEIDKGQHLGYRKGARGGKWVARFYDPKHGRTCRALGTADDTVEADGTHVLNFGQAIKKAQAEITGIAQSSGSKVRYGKYTVRDAANDYLSKWEESDPNRKATQQRIDSKILPTLGDVAIDKLTRGDIENWLHGAARSTRTKDKRASLETANRNFNTLRRMLESAYERGLCPKGNMAWDSVKRIANTERVGTETLTLDEAQAFWAKCPEDFAALVYGAITTGCRYGELCNMRVGDFKPDRACIEVMQGKTQHEKCIFLLPEELAWFTTHTMGRKQDEPMFVRVGDSMRDRKEKSKAGWWGRSHQKVRMAEALEAAGIKRHVTFRDLRRTFGSWLANRGTGMDVIAKQLGHRSTRITAKHYTQFTPEYLAAQVLANKPVFSPFKPTEEGMSTPVAGDRRKGRLLTMVS